MYVVVVGGRWRGGDGGVRRCTKLWGRRCTKLWDKREEGVVVGRFGTNGKRTLLYKDLGQTVCQTVRDSGGARDSSERNTCPEICSCDLL